MAAPHVRPAVRPSGWWYLAAAGVALLGLVLGGILVGRAFRDAQQAGFDASLLQAGEDQTLTILDPGGYTIAYSGPIIIYDTQERQDLIDRLDIEIRPAAGGDPLVLHPYDGLNDLQQDGAQYVPLLTVRFEQAGDYVLQTADAGLDPERSAIVVSESPFRKLREGVENALAVVAISWLLAILGTVILARVRGRAKRALPPPPPPGWGAGPGWGGGQGGGPGGPGAPGVWPPPQWPPGGQPQQWPAPSPGQQWPAPAPQQWPGGPPSPSAGGSAPGW